MIPIVYRDVDSYSVQRQRLSYSLPLFSLKPLDATTWLRSLLSKVFPDFYLYKCSHFLCSQACTCSYKSLLSLYNSHLCDNHGFPLRIRRCLNEKKKKRILIKSYHDIYQQFCSLLIASGKTGCFTHCEKSKHKSRGVQPTIAYTGKLRPKVVPSQTSSV